VNGYGFINFFTTSGLLGVVVHRNNHYDRENRKALVFLRLASIRLMLNDL